MEPDIVAYTPEEAEDILARHGIRVVGWSLTRPPGTGVPLGERRVVQQKMMAPGQVKLVVAYRDYARG